MFLQLCKGCQEKPRAYEQRYPKIIDNEAWCSLKSQETYQQRHPKTIDIKAYYSRDENLDTLFGIYLKTKITPKTKDGKKTTKEMELLAAIIIFICDIMY